MKYFSRVSFSVLWLLPLLFLLSGCTSGSFVQTVRVDEKYLNKVTEAKLQFAPAKYTQTLAAELKDVNAISESAKQSQSSEAQEIARKLSTAFIPLMVKEAQEKCQLKIQTEGDSDTSLILTLRNVYTKVWPKRALSALEKYEAISNGTYREVDSEHWLSYDIELRELKSGREIWSGKSTFRIWNFDRTRQGQADFAKAVGEFATNLAFELRKSDLIKRI